VAESRLYSIDALRGVAATGVLLVHIPHWPSGPLLAHPFGLAGLALDFGRMGVPLFIVLSGFCIHRSTRQTRHSENPKRISWRQFFGRRLERLYVPYVVAILLGLLSITATTGWASMLTHLPFDLAMHLCMVQNLLIYPSQGVGNGPLWTIGLEFQLYLLYPIIFCSARKWGWGPTLFSVFFINLAWALTVPWVMVRCGASKEVCLGAPVIWVFEYWFIWCLGAYAAELIELRVPFKGRSLVLAGICLFGLGFASDYRILFVIQNSTTLSGTFSTWLVLMNQRGGSVANVLCIMCFGGAFFLMVIALQKVESATLIARNPLFRVFSLLGLVSYSLYLTHTPVLHMLKATIPPYEDNSALRPWLVGYIFGVPACIAFAGLYYWFIERHFLVKRSRVGLDMN
jgi:peptidoglycan/LPS O-acetylase OafA/YrhL